jgi:phospholipid/cholesterol/gamma-HCH transport system substrate-binding protein
MEAVQSNFLLKGFFNKKKKAEAKKVADEKKEADKKKKLEIKFALDSIKTQNLKTSSKIAIDSLNQ